MTESFSNRYGYGPPDAEITIREDAPDALRVAIPMIAEQAGMTPKQMRADICNVLLVQPDPDNWSLGPVRMEVQALIGSCHWSEVYNIAEVLHSTLNATAVEKAEEFSERLTRFFREKRIGWEMREGQVVFRGQSFTESTKAADTVLRETGRTGAASEIQEAIRDISRRLQPDVTGAMHHAMAALEATARDVTGRPKPTLGQLIPQLGLPKPLDTAAEKMWGYASDRARHVGEDKPVDSSEAELVVTVCSALCIFLAKKSQARSAKSDSW